jgi:hypothetical protein
VENAFVPSATVNSAECSFESDLRSTPDHRHRRIYLRSFPSSPLRHGFRDCSDAVAMRHLDDVRSCERQRYYTLWYELFTSPEHQAGKEIPFLSSVA